MVGADGILVLRTGINTNERLTAGVIDFCLEETIETKHLVSMAHS